MDKNKPNTVDEYMADFPEETQATMQQIRGIIKEIAPKAEEGISYGMPAYKLNGKPLVYFAGYKSHIGFYATPTGHAEFADELSRYKQGKGSVQFPLTEPMPFDLIKRIVEFRVEESLTKAKPGKSQKKGSPINQDVQAYNDSLSDDDTAICNLLAREINKNLPDAENKIWHRHPVWFLEGNPIVGYSKLKDSVRLLFWSGQSFEEDALQPEGSFKAAEARYTSVDQVNVADLRRWLKKSEKIQWDYKNIVKRRGVLERLK